MGFLSDLFDPGRGDRRQAAQAAEAGLFGGTRTSGPFGISGQIDVGNSMVHMNSDLGQFNPIAQMLLGRAGAGFTGQGAADLNFLDPIFSGSMGDLRDPRLTGVDNMSNFQGLGSMFQSALPIANADPFQLGAGVTDRLRAGAVPENQRLVNSAMSRLFASGRLGTTGGANVAGRLQETLNQQDLGFQQAGLEFGRGLQSDALGRAMSAFGGRESMAGRLFGERATAANMRGQNAMSRIGAGSNMAQLLMQNLLQGQNMGIQSLGAATGLAQLPLAFQSAALAAEAARSGAHFNQAAILQGNAQMAKSPLLEGIGAIGQFFEPIKFGG